MKNRILIVPRGEFPHEKGLQVMDQQAIERMHQAAKNNGRDIPIDFGHETFISPTAEAAGWLKFKTLNADSNGLWGEIEWTDDAEKLIGQKKFRYLSPVFSYNPKHSKKERLYIDRIVSIGLTNHPNITAMKPLFNQLQMEGTMDEFLIKLREALGLSADADSNEVSKTLFERLDLLLQTQNEIASFKESMGVPKETPLNEIAGNMPAKPDAQAIDSAQPDTQELQKLKEELVSMKKNETESKVKTAITSGKLLPAQKEWAFKYAESDPSGFDSFLANSSAVVQMGGLIDASRKSGASLLPLDDIQAEINSLLGIKREDYENYNQ